jgi:hypothetical protein
MTCRTRALVLALCGLGSVDNVARAQSGSWKPSKQLVLAPAGNFGKLLTADLSGDLIPDAISSHNNELLFLFNPGNFSSAMPLPVIAKDFAVLRGGSPDSNDSLLIASGTKVSHVWFDWDAASYSGQGQVVGDYFLEDDLQLPAPWPTLERLTVHRRQAVFDVFGYQPGSGLWKLQDLFGGQIQSLMALPPIIIDFVLVDWDGTAPIDIAYVCSDHMAVVDQLGQTLYYQQAYFDSGHIASYTEAGSSVENIVAAMVPTGLSSHYLYVVGPSTPFEAPLDLGPTGVQGLATADFTADGNEDVVLSSSASVDPVVFFNRGVSGQSFSWAQAQLLDSGLGGGPAFGQTGRPVAADLDLDGDSDVLVAIDFFDQAVMLAGASADLSTQVPVVPYIYDEEAGQAEPGGSYDWVNGVGTLDLTLQMPSNPIAGATDLEVTIWRQPSATEPIEQAALLHEFVNWSQVQADQGLTLNILGEADIVTDTIFWLEWRLVNYSGSNLVNAGPRNLQEFSTASLVTEIFFDDDISVPITLPPSAIESRSGGSGVTPWDDPGEFEEDPPSAGPPPSP